MRKLMRSVARYNMTKKGIQHMNKRPWVRDASGMISKADSFFSLHWRDYVGA